MSDSSSSDNNANNNEESDSLSLLNNNNRVRNINLMNSPAADRNVEETRTVEARLREQIQALKNLSSLKQNLLNVREGQVKELIQKLKFFEEAIENEKIKRAELNERTESAEAERADLAERLRANVAAFDDAKSEYENRIVELIANLEGATAKCDAARVRIAELENKVTEMEACKSENARENAGAPSSSNNEPSNGRHSGCAALIQTLKSELKDATDKNRILSYQMTLLNTLFSETEETAIDFDRIRAIGDIVRDSKDLALDPVNVESPDQPESDLTEDRLLDLNASDERKASFDVNGLIEKLDASNQRKLQEIPGEESCYKSVDTTAGPKLVLSVSKTFIKLKDLILEKKSLQKEIEGLKELNDKLSVKVDQQERRLYCVTGELNKTWSLVATLKAQHKQLHNSKAVLRYELQEKRKLLEKLKRDLSISREKWIRVRQKNSESEVEWLRIREEFTKRRNQVTTCTGGESSQISQSTSTSGVYLSEEGQPLLQHSTSPSTISDDGQEQEDDEVESVRIQESQDAEQESRDHRHKEGPSKSKSTDSADIEDNENVDSEDLEALEEEGACGIDYAKVALEFDDPLDELEDLAEEIKTIEAAAATTDEDEDDDDDDSHNGNGGSGVGGLFNGTELNLERLVNRRAARLQVLEEQCRLLYKKLSASKAKSVTLYAKLAKLHNYYGSDSDDGTTDQSHPTETSDDAPFGRRREEEDASTSSQHVLQNPTRDTREYSYTELGIDGDLDTNENPSEDEPDRERGMSLVPLIHGNDSMEVEDDGPASSPALMTHEEPETSSVGAENTEPDQPQSKQLSEQEALSAVNDVNVLRDLQPEPEPRGSNSASSSNTHNDLVEKETTTTRTQEEQIASETRELQLTEVVGQSTNYDHNLDSMNHETATIIITDETMERIARSQNHLVVRNGDVVQPTPTTTMRVRSLPNAQQPLFDEMNSSVVVNTERTSHSHLHSHQNLASALMITNPVVVSTFSHEIPSRDPANRNSPLPPPPRNPSPFNNHESSPSPLRDHDDDDIRLTTKDETDPAEPGSPADLSSLGRLIIQQLPKRLDLLKHENNALKDELRLADKILKKTEEELQNEKQLSHLLQVQIEQQNLLELKLQEELELQQQIIEELKNEIGHGKHCFDNLLSEKQTLSNFVELYNEDKLIYDQRFIARSTARKNCEACQFKFGFFKKKYNCKICGYDFCSKCSSERKLFQADGELASEASSTEKVKGHICIKCKDRRERLEVLRVEATLETNV